MYSFIKKIISNFFRKGDKLLVRTEGRACSINSLPFFTEAIGSPSLSLPHVALPAAETETLLEEQLGPRPIQGEVVEGKGTVGHPI